LLFMSSFAASVSPDVLVMKNPHKSWFADCAH